MGKTMQISKCPITGMRGYSKKWYRRLITRWRRRREKRDRRPPPPRTTTSTGPSRPHGADLHDGAMARSAFAHEP
jgi:hypothetical protein